MIRIGLDLHGVIDKDPEFFVDLSNNMISNGNEVYVITGQEINDDLFTQLKNCGMMGKNLIGSWRYFNDILSVTTYRKKQGVEIWHLDGRESQPMMDEHIWETTKAVLCFENKIDIMIDDSINYEKTFKNIDTHYIIYNDSMKEFLKNMLYRR